MLNVTGKEPFSTQFSEQLLPMALHTVGFSLVRKGNYLFLFGADTECRRPIAVRLDVKTNIWLDLKLPPYQEFVGKAIALLKGNIYLFGGMRVTRTNQNTLTKFTSACASQYSIEPNSWSKLENLPKSLAFHSAASYENYVFSAGGSLQDSEITDKLYAYDVVGQIWLTKAAMNCKRVMFSMETFGAQLVACGGKYSPSVEIYNIADDQWTLIDGDLDHYYSPATIILNDKLYVIGGSYINEDGTTTNTDYLSCVDVSNGLIERKRSLPFTVSLHHAVSLLTVPNTASERGRSQTASKPPQTHAEKRCHYYALDVLW